MTNHKFHFEFDMYLGATTLTVNVKSNASLIALKAPSGSGKSSFIRIVAGLNKKFHGIKNYHQQKIGYVPQDSLLIPTLDVKSNLLLSPYADKNELADVCDNLSIGHLLHRYPRMLSGGEKQRVSIGRALLSNPQLLILDEPFAALDYEIRTSIGNYLKEWIKNKKVDLILVTHDEVSSELLCEEFWTIKDNKLSVAGPYKIRI
jgi:molybdate transport system ATP-binding protein